jgi:hypothetical protein
MPTFHAIRTIALMALIGSSTDFAAADVGSEVNLVFEICRPHVPITEASDMGYQSVTTSGYGGLWLAPNKTTTAHEAVYYHYSGNSDRQLAITVRFADAKNTIYVFMRPPGDQLQLNQWSAWRLPDAITNAPNIEGLIIRKIKVASKPVDVSGPTIRYKLMTFDAYLTTLQDKSSSPVVIYGGSCMKLPE